MLSKGGKEVLIKSVAQACPSYAMSVFKIPVGICDDISSMISNFWWSNKKDSRGLAWVSWRKLCDKKDKGGLGFRDMKAFNLALLAKQGWRIISNPSSLMARILKAKYFPTVSFWDAPRPKWSSYTWKSICDARDILYKGCRWDIGNGKQVHAWTDKWVPRPLSFKVISACPNPSLLNLKVADLISPAGEWNKDLLNLCFQAPDVEIILQIPLSTRVSREDRIIWHYDKWGQYTVKSGYTLAKKQIDEAENRVRGESSSNSPDWSVNIWKLHIPEKIKHFIWRVYNDSLPT